MTPVVQLRKDARKNPRMDPRAGSMAANTSSERESGYPPKMPSTSVPASILKILGLKSTA